MLIVNDDQLHSTGILSLEICVQASDQNLITVRIRYENRIIENGMLHGCSPGVDILIDGAPAARFTQRLKELIESGYGLFDSTVESIKTFV